MKTVLRVSSESFKFWIWFVEWSQNKSEMKKPLVILTTNIIIIIHLFFFFVLVNHGQSCKRPRRVDTNGAEHKSFNPPRFSESEKQTLIHFLVFSKRPLTLFLLILFSQLFAASSFPCQEPTLHHRFYRVPTLILMACPF